MIYQEENFKTNNVHYQRLVINLFDLKNIKQNLAYEVVVMS